MNLSELIEEIEYQQGKLIIIKTIILIVCSAPIIYIVCKHFGFTVRDSRIFSLFGSTLFALLIKKE